MKTIDGLRANRQPSSNPTHATQEVQLTPSKKKDSPKSSRKARTPGASPKSSGKARTPGEKRQEIEPAASTQPPTESPKDDKQQIAEGSKEAEKKAEGSQDHNVTSPKKETRKERTKRLHARYMRFSRSLVSCTSDD